MKKNSDHELEVLLSQYIDGELSAQEAEEVESILKMDASARRRVEELKRLKDLLASKQKLNPDIGFWTRLSVVLEKGEREEHNFFPFAQKYFPAVSVAATIAVVAVGVMVIQNRIKVIQLFTDKSSSVKEVYNKKIAQGSLLPLFSKVDKDRAFQFSLFGTLQLDERSETALRVDEQSDKGYKIEVGKDLKSRTKPVTFNRFLSEVKPTEEQKKIIDSLLELTGRRIESSVLIGDNNTMAIAPDLPKLNMLMVSNIASCLKPNQRARFKRFLESNDAPYTVRVPQTTTARNENFYQNISQVQQGDSFFIITPDTTVYSQLHINFDSLRQQMETDIVSMRIRREAMLKRMMRMEFQNMQRNIPPSPHVQISGGEESISIEINANNEEIRPRQTQFIIQRRPRQQVFIRKTPGRSSESQIHKDTIRVDVAPVR